MKKLIYLSSIVAVSLALAGCASMGTHSSSANTSGSGVQSYGLGSQNGGFNGQNLNSNYQATPQQRSAIAHMPRVVHFAFAQYGLNGQAKHIAAENAQFLLQNPDQFVMLAGNTDPRGSQEYNFHLGQRRADAVKDYLLAQGVSPSQVCTVSYGELRPAASPGQFGGNWQKAYQMDRRTEIVYGQRCEGAATHG